MSTRAAQTPFDFWKKVDRTAPDACWEWRLHTDSSGYGQTRIAGKTYMAHRVAAYFSGLVPSLSAPLSSKSPWHVLHTCDNRKCCNPKHFFLGNYSDNQNDKVRKGRMPKRRQNSKLTEQEVRDIRAAYATGRSAAKVAADYGISGTSVYRIVHKQHWGDVK